MGSWGRSLSRRIFCFLYLWYIIWLIITYLCSFGIVDIVFSCACTLISAHTCLWVDISHGVNCHCLASAFLPHLALQRHCSLPSFRTPFAANETLPVCSLFWARIIARFHRSRSCESRGSLTALFKPRPQRQYIWFFIFERQQRRSIHHKCDSQWPKFPNVDWYREVSIVTVDTEVSEFERLWLLQ